MKVISETRGAH